MDEKDPSATTIANLNKMIADLESKIEERDAEIDELTEKANSLEHQLDGNAAGWSRHRPWTVDDLPVPRLEIRWTRNNEGRGATALYVMVYRHYADDSVIGVPMGRTRVDGGSAQNFVRIDGIAMPFRDGVHLWKDCEQLNLPAFVTTEDGDADRVKPGGDRIEQETVRRTPAPCA